MLDIWRQLFYKSPQHDLNYIDIANYSSVQLHAPHLVKCRYKQLRLNAYISPQLGNIYTTTTPLVGVTLEYLHHNANSMNSINTCTDSVLSVWNITLIYLSRPKSRVIKQIQLNKVKPTDANKRQ